MKRLFWVVGILAVVVIGATFGATRILEGRYNRVRVRPPYAIPVEATNLQRKLFVADLHADSLLWGRQLALLVCVMVFCVVSIGQGLPTTASVPELSKTPRKFDGHLVQVRAWLAFGWESDNFLYDSAKPAPRKTADFRAASVWFYCKLDRECKVRDTIQFGGPPALGTFTGYFHFVPDQKSGMKDVFDPGSLQLEVVGVSDITTNTKPNTLRSATPHN